jgi:hypothetical protein
MARRLGIATVVIGAMIVGVCAFESVFRLVDPWGTSYYVEIDRFFGQALKSNQDFAYTGRPGLHDTFQGVEVRINSKGFRGREFPQRKPGNHRIMVLGDSVPFGWGVSENDTAPEILRTMLERTGLSFDVITCAVPSWNTRIEYEFLKREGLSYNPDVVVLWIDGNDVVPNLSCPTDVDKEILRGNKSARPQNLRAKLMALVHRSPLRRFYTYAALVSSYRLSLAGQQMNAMYHSDAPAWTDARLALEGIIRCCEVHGITLVAFLYVFPQTPPDPAIDAYGKVLAQHKIPLHRFPDAHFSPELRNSATDGHPNAQGHALIAKTMFETLKPQLEEIDRR